MTAAQLAAFLGESIPDGTYGQAVRQPQQTETVLRPWTPAEQKAHREELCDALGIPDDTDPNYKPSNKKRSKR